MVGAIVGAFTGAFLGFLYGFVPASLFILVMSVADVADFTLGGICAVYLVPVLIGMVIGGLIGLFVSEIDG
jgi:hypothetical protein